MPTPFAITLDPASSRRNLTGTWRVERPVYVDHQPPCNTACPAGENVQAWLYRAEEGDYEGAWRRLMEDNPLPATMGRVCYHPCEDACNRVHLDEAVGINAVERFLGDEAIRQGWKVDPPTVESGKRVLIIGAGPAGLSAAYHLRRLGHSVTLADGSDRAGGMMRFGIPAYRLPRTVLDAEVDRILAMGVELRLEETVGDIRQSMRQGGYDAAFLAVGARLGHRAFIPAGDSTHVLDALELLRDVAGDEPPQLGRRVVVYGGGNTALDAARTAKRLGAAESVVVYRRTRDRMPAHPIEVEEALAEGVRMRWLSTITQAGSGSLVVEKMKLDESGFPQPTGDLEELPADSLVLALGQDTDLSLVEGIPEIDVADGVVKVTPNLMTGLPGVFAGGDMVPAQRTVTTAIGHGKRAARSIDAWLRALTVEAPPKLPEATADKLNPWYYSDAPRTLQPVLDAVRRQSTFDEVVGGLDASNALFEARRCLSCGNCFECDNCYAVCPDNAVIKLGPGKRYEFDFDYCKGCALCAAECPCGAIEMVPEPTI